MQLKEVTVTVPELWRTILNDIRSVGHPEAVLAGGALRDLVWGYPAKDLDIFVSAFAPRLTFPQPDNWAVSRSIYGSYFGGMRAEVSDVVEFLTPHIATPVQVVALHVQNGTDFINEVLSRMDFDACRVGYDGHRVLATPEGYTALTDRRMTLLRCEDVTQAGRSLRRAERFAARYTDVTLDVSLAQLHQSPEDTSTWVL